MNTGFYEAMFIIHPGDDEESSRNEVIDEIVAEIKKHKGIVLSIKRMGKKQFAFPIKKRKDGYYYLFYIEIDTQAIQKMKEKYRINTRILREMFVRLEKAPEPVALDESAEEQAETVAEPAVEQKPESEAPAPQEASDETAQEPAEPAAEPEADVEQEEIEEVKE